MSLSIINCGPHPCVDQENGIEFSKELNLYLVFISNSRLNHVLFAGGCGSHKRSFHAISAM
jgi:hypothetical protein